MVLSTTTPEIFSVINMPDGAVHNLGDVNLIPLGEGRRFDIDGQSIAVFRSRQGQVFATQAHCPHKAGPLADGLMGGNSVICPLHNFRFNLDTGEPMGNDCPALRTYPVSLTEAGEIVISARA